MNDYLAISNLSMVRGEKKGSEFIKLQSCSLSVLIYKLGLCPCKSTDI